MLGARQGEPVRWVTNSQGFRNTQEITPLPAEDTLRVLLLGDSFIDGMRTGQQDTIGAVLERNLEQRLQQNPGDLEALQQKSRHLTAQGDFENAMECLLTIMRTDRSFGEDAGRAGLIEIFDNVLCGFDTNRYAD